MTLSISRHLLRRYNCYRPERPLPGGTIPRREGCRFPEITRGRDRVVNIDQGAVAPDADGHSPRRQGQTKCGWGAESLRPTTETLTIMVGCVSEGP
jgi:hypothetical protein